MTFNPPTFLPPVLAVGAGASPNGRQQLGSGLITHRGILEANSLRANGYLWPQSGRGTELGFQNVAPYGYLQVIDRDTINWLDLQLTAKNITLNPQSGGKVIMPAGTAQALIGSYRAVAGYTIPATNAWYETNAQVSATCTGGLIRLEACGTLTHATATGIIYIGFMVDGAVYLDSLQATSSGASNNLMPFSVVAYHQTPAGPHRWSVCLFTNQTGASGLWSGGYTNMWVTEQRA